MKKEKIINDFLKYSNAVNAERYRVTCRQAKLDGKTLIIDKKDGVSIGFTQQELIDRMPEIIRIAERGENIYFTPMSEGKHHILIDDLTVEKLKQLISDGYRPAVLIESSPGNYQAIITISKFNIDIDKEIGNLISNQLNKNYGDPNLSGAIHAHRAPGFYNLKSKYQRPDGTYPAVKLLKAETRQCDKTLKLAEQLKSEIEERNKSIDKSINNNLETQTINYFTSDVLKRIYLIHFNNITKNIDKGNIDFSKIDGKIAIRLRVTGHIQEETKKIIETGTQSVRPADRQKVNVIDYANRTAAYAFSNSVKWQIAELQRFKDFWLKIENETVNLTKERSNLTIEGR